MDEAHIVLLRTEHEKKKKKKNSGKRLLHAETIKQAQKKEN